jgi:hypothetical protein
MQIFLGIKIRNEKNLMDGIFKWWMKRSLDGLKLEKTLTCLDWCQTCPISLKIF